MITRRPHSSSFLGGSYLEFYKVIPKRNYYGASKVGGSPKKELLCGLWVGIRVQVIRHLDLTS